MLRFNDQTGHEVCLEGIPKRIVSLVPSQTELLFDLGLGSRVVGRTKFCIHPKNQVKNIPIIGGTKKFNFDLIDEIAPDLILGNKEENYKEGIEQLRSKYPTWTSDIFDLDDALEMIEAIGTITDIRTEAFKMVDAIKVGWESLRGICEAKVLYFIWQKPYMVAGKNTFIDFVLSHLGFQNIVLQKRYPEIDEYVLMNYEPDIVFLSSEPFPFKEKHISEFKSLFPNARVQLVDGEMFSWYGSHLVKAAEYFQHNFIAKV